MCCKQVCMISRIGYKYFDKHIFLVLHQHPFKFLSCSPRPPLHFLLHLSVGALVKSIEYTYVIPFLFVFYIVCSLFYYLITQSLSNLPDCGRADPSDHLWECPTYGFELIHNGRLGFIYVHTLLHIFKPIFINRFVQKLLYPKIMRKLPKLIQ